MKETIFKKFGIALHEPSTWTAVIALLSLVGVHFEPDQASAIIQAGVGLGGVLGLFFKWDTVPASETVKPTVDDAEKSLDEIVQDSRE